MSRPCGGLGCGPSDDGGAIRRFSMIGRVISRSWSVRPLTLVVRIMGCRFGTDALSVMTLVVTLVGLESEWVPGLARVSAARDFAWLCLAGFRLMCG